MLPELLQECHPFVTAKLVAPPDKIHFEFHFPTIEELHDFVCLHGAGFPACPNDSSLAALTSYIHQVVISKIRIGVPKDKPVHVPCGFLPSEVEPSRLVLICHDFGPQQMSMSRQNHLILSGHPGVSGASAKQTISPLIHLSHTVPSKRGTRHAFIMKLWSQHYPKP